jgi:hypothetical protein
MSRQGSRKNMPHGTRGETHSRTAKGVQQRSTTNADKGRTSSPKSRGSGGWGKKR